MDASCNFAICAVGIGAPQAQRKQKKVMGFESSTKGAPGERGTVERFAMSEEALQRAYHLYQEMVQGGNSSGVCLAVWDLLKLTSIWGSYQSGFNKRSRTSRRYIKKYIYCKELVQAILGPTSKSKTQRAGYQEGQTGDTAVARRNFFFVRETSILLLRPVN